MSLPHHEPSVAILLEAGGNRAARPTPLPLVPKSKLPRQKNSNVGLSKLYAHAISQQTDQEDTLSVQSGGLSDSISIVESPTPSSPRTPPSSLPVCAFRHRRMSSLNSTLHSSDTSDYSYEDSAQPALRVREAHRPGMSSNPTSQPTSSPISGGKTPLAKRFPESPEGEREQDNGGELTPRNPQPRSLPTSLRPTHHPKAQQRDRNMSGDADVAAAESDASDVSDGEGGTPTRLVEDTDHLLRRHCAVPLERLERYGAAIGAVETCIAELSEIASGDGQYGMAVAIDDDMCMDGDTREAGGNGAVDMANRGSSSKGKRRAREEEPDESLPGRESSDGDRGSMRNPDPVGRRRKRLKQEGFSCPYRKLDPIVFNVRAYEQCANHGYSTITELKKHIVAHHYCLSCLRCHQRFRHQDALQQHLRLPRACDLSSEEPAARDLEDGITLEVANNLKSRSYADKVGTWPRLWNVLFGPDVPLKDQDFDPIVELDEVMQESRIRLEQLEQGLDERIAAMLGSERLVTWSRPHIEDVKMFVFRWIEELFTVCRSIPGRDGPIGVSTEAPEPTKMAVPPEQNQGPDRGVSDRPEVPAGTHVGSFCGGEQLESAQVISQPISEDLVPFFEVGLESDEPLAQRSGAVLVKFPLLGDSSSTPWPFQVGDLNGHSLAHGSDVTVAGHAHMSTNNLPLDQEDMQGIGISGQRPPSLAEILIQKNRGSLGSEPPNRDSGVDMRVPQACPGCGGFMGACACHGSRTPLQPPRSLEMTSREAMLSRGVTQPRIGSWHVGGQQ